MSRALTLVLALTVGEAEARDTRAPILLTQRNVGGAPLCPGCPTSMAVEITASSDAAACGSVGLQYTLELELIPIASPFSSVPTQSSMVMIKPPCTQQQYPWTTLTGLVPGTAYRWQVRESASSGSTDVWVPFNGGATAFSVVAPDGGTLDAGSFDAGNNDAGAGPSDAGGATSEDGGAGPSDAGGTASEDGGAKPSDGGRGTDGGDAGTEGLDGSSADAGLAPSDGGALAPDNRSLAVGCACSSSSAPPFVLLVLAAFVWFRRRAVRTPGGVRSRRAC